MGPGLRWDGRPVQVARQVIALVLFLYFAIGILFVSLPNPRKLTDRKRWQTERTAREFERWGQPFGADAQEVEAFLWPIAQATARTVRVLRRPFDPAIGYLGFYQSWRMFSVPHTESAFLRVELETDGAYETVYEARSHRYTWRRHQFDQNRMRKLVARACRRGEGLPWNRLVAFLAKRASEEFPEADEIRVTSVGWVAPKPEAFVRGDEPATSVKAQKVLELRIYR